MFGQNTRLSLPEIAISGVSTCWPNDLQEVTASILFLEGTLTALGNCVRRSVCGVQPWRRFGEEEMYVWSPNRLSLN